MVPPCQTDPVGRGTLALNTLPWQHRVYRWVAALLSGPLLCWLWWRGRREPAYRERLAERLGHIEVPASHRYGIWLHAASVGEVQAARPFLEQLLQHVPAEQILVTTQTPTGAMALRQHWGERLTHRYAPLDTQGSTRRFLQNLQPRCLILLEREVWPEWLRQCQAQAIPVALVNARLTPTALRTYQSFAGLMAGIWPHLALCATIDEPTNAAFAALGVPTPALKTTGNFKFDVAPSQAALTLPEGIGTRQLFVAGSTHAEDETELLRHWPRFHERHPSALLVLVPRHPQRFDTVAQSLQQHGLPFVRRDQAPTALTPSTQVLLVDRMGELSQWYRHATWCFVGGTLAPVGGHNPLEAMAWGQAVLFGPHCHHFPALYQALTESGGGQAIQNGGELFETASAWLAQDQLPTRGAQAASFWQRHQGASARTVQALCTWPQNPLQHPMAAVQSHTQEGCTVWFDPTRLPLCRSEHFDPPTQADPQARLATGSGRGEALRLSLHGQAVVLRHYRRGGWMARLSRDRYWGTAPAQGRSMQEYALLRWMHAQRLPVPAPVGARHQNHGHGFYSADILVAWLPETRNLAQCLDQTALSLGEWYRVGQAIGDLHRAQVFHADLNCHNLLLGPTGQVWIIDFDKCAIKPGHHWKKENLARLLRSLRKEQQRRPGFQWKEDNWFHFLNGYSNQKT